MSNLAFDRTLHLIVKQCGNCGIEFGVPALFDEERHKTGSGWFCPNGHERVYRKTREQELREELEAEQRRVAFERSRRESAEREAAAARGQITKLRKRIEKGVCPHCQRTFTNVARHMQTQHKDACTA